MPWASAGGAKRAFAAPLETGTKNQKFIKKAEDNNLIPINDLIIAMTVYLPVRNSHCTRARFVQ